MVRTPCCDQTGLKKGTWTAEEDRKLMAYVTRYGCWNWRQLPKYAGLRRCGKSCRLRWMNYLRPNIKRGNYSKEEDDTIIRLHESLGNRWSAIAAQLPGRTDNEIKNHWHTNLKKRKQQTSVNHEVKPNPNDFVKPETIQEVESKPDINILTKPPSPQIFEGLPLSSRSCPIVVSSVTTDSSVFIKAELSPDHDKAALVQSSAVLPSESFWTEPFLSDNCYNISNEFLAPLLDPAGYLGPHSPLLDGEMLCPWAYGFPELQEGLMNY